MPFMAQDLMVLASDSSNTQFIWVHAFYGTTAKCFWSSFDEPYDGWYGFYAFHDAGYATAILQFATLTVLSSLQQLYQSADNNMEHMGMMMK